MSDPIGFLISDVSRLMRRHFDERARTIGVTRTQWRTLTTLSRHEGINQGGLADLLEVEPITLCRMIDRLEEAGLVERRRDPEDRRAWRIFLTAKALPLLKQIRSLADGLYVEALDGIPADSTTAMVEALNAIRSNLSSPSESEHANHG